MDGMVVTAWPTSRSLYSMPQAASVLVTEMLSGLFYSTGANALKPDCSTLMVLERA